jgi:hypothetical protein
MARDHPEYWNPKRSLGESIAGSIARDLAYGRPAHIWNFKPAAGRDETLWTNLAIVAHGNISSTFVHLKSDSPVYPELFEINRSLGSILADMQPYGEVAVHVSRELLEKAWPAENEDMSYRQRYEALYAPVLQYAQVLPRPVSL